MSEVDIKQKVRQDVSEIFIENTMISADELFPEGTATRSAKDILESLGKIVYDQVKDFGFTLGDGVCFALSYSRNEQANGKERKPRDLKAMRERAIHLFDHEGLERKEVAEALGEEFDDPPSYETICKWIKEFLESLKTLSSESVPSGIGVVNQEGDSESDAEEDNPDLSNKAEIYAPKEIGFDEGQEKPF